MRLVDDKDLSFCLTMSEGIELGELLSILGAGEALPVPHSFEETPLWKEIHPEEQGLVNVFEEDGVIITLDNGGYSGVKPTTVGRVIEATKNVSHYVALQISQNVKDQIIWCWYVEVQDGILLASFSPLTGSAPEIVDQFFDDHDNVVKRMVEAVEYRMEMSLKDEWLTKKTDTYVMSDRY